MIETHIKALTRIKENYGRLWYEHLLKEKDVKEEYEAVCAGIEALEQQPCDDCISRQELLKRRFTVIDDGDMYQVVYVEDVEDAPSVEPERKTGKWIEGKKTPGYIKWNCSECGLLVRNPQKPWYEYCPKCGAPMEVNENETDS